MISTFNCYFILNLLLAWAQILILHMEKEVIAAKPLTPCEGMSVGAFDSPAYATQLSLVEEIKRRRELSELSAVWERRDFPLKKFLSMKFN